MANTKVTQHVIADNAITTAMITDANVTHAKLHGTMDLSGKTVTLPAVAIPSASTATTQSALDNSTKVATTSYVDSAVTALIDSAPSGLNTLNELAAALNDDTSFSSTVTTSLAAKAPLASPSFTGTVQLLNTNFPDNRAARFGDSQDLQIYHDGTHSYVASSTGSLYIRTGNTLQIENQSGSEDLATFAVNGAATLFYDNSSKLATSSYGVDIQGTGALKIPVGTTGERPTAATGQLRWNSTDGALEVYNGSAWTAVGTGSSNKILDTFTGDGSTTAFTLSITPANEDALLVFIDGVYQEKGDYALSNAVLTLDTAPASGEKVAVHTTTASVHDGTSALNQQFTGDGSTTAFTLSQDPKSENNTQIYINGVYQQKTDYTVSGTTLTFDTAPTSGDIIEANMFTVATLGNSDTVTEGSSNLYHTSARAISAISGATLTGNLTTTTLTANHGSYNSVLGGNSLTFSRNGDNNILAEAGTSANINLRSGNKIVSNATSYHAWKTGSGADERMRITSSGNVGIGTDSPSDPLVVESSGSIGGGATNANSYFTITDGTYGLYHDPNEIFSDINGTFHIGANHANGSLRFHTGGTDARMNIASSGDIGIGTTSPSHDVHIKRDATETALAIQSNIGGSGSAYGGRLRLQLGAQSNTGSGNADTQAGDVLGQIMFEGQGTDYSYQGGNIKTIVTTGDGNDDRSNQATAMTFETIAVGSVSPAERIRIQSSGGISFNGDTATANALDDYEEGTWSPNLIGTTGSAGSYATGGSPNAHYTKVGRLVTIQCTFYITNKGSYSGKTRLTGLPFAAATSTTALATGSFPDSGYGTTSGNVLISAAVDGATNYIAFFDGSRLDPRHDYADVGTGYYINVAGSYMAAT